MRSGHGIDEAANASIEEMRAVHQTMPILLTGGLRSSMKKRSASTPFKKRTALRLIQPER
jgi:hypothetical protein